MSSACVAVGRKLGFDSVDCTVPQAMLGTFHSGLDCVVADCMPAGFLVAHLEVIFSFRKLCMYLSVAEVLLKRHQVFATRNRSLSYI